MGKIIENNVLRFEYDTGSSEDIGKIQIRKGTDWVPSISKILMRMGRKPLQILTYSDVKKTDNFHKMTITMANHMEFILKLEENSPALFIIPKSHQTIRNVNLTLEITINFHGSNQYDYINLSGLKYQKVKNPKKFSLKVPPTGAFGQSWTIHEGELYCGIIGMNQIQILNFQAKFSPQQIVLSKKVKAKAKVEFCLIAGSGGLGSPMREKLLKILPIKPLPIKYDEDLKTEAQFSFNTLYKHFLLKTKSGKVPSNFIFYKSERSGEISYGRAKYCTIGNCFSLGFITGTMAMNLWKNDTKYLDILFDEFLPPLLDDALIKSGPIAGAYLDTYNQKLDYWTTGRIQDPEKGFTDFFPIKRDKKGSKISWIIPPIKEQLRKGLWLFLAEKIHMFTIGSGNSAIYKKFEELVVSPPYSGQIAYNMFQVLTQLPNAHSDPISMNGMERQLYQSLQLTVEFLMKYQRKDGLWDQELKEDGEIFWDRKTIACIYPAVLLYWWGSQYTDEKALNAATAAIQGCVRLLEDGEYYGLYFETDAANNQGDLVTAVGCIKCFSKLYELTKREEWLNHARSAAWHLLSYMWGTGVRDTQNNLITGGMPVTTYMAMGFPVIGGSELCQAIEGLLELSIWDRSFLVYAEAGLGFHSHYMYYQYKNDRATHEIMWGTLENWSTSTSVDFASYATGPLIRSFYLYSKIREINK